MEPIQPELAATELPTKKKSIDTQKPDRTGQQLGSYRLLRLLADGGFASVYLGEHIHLNTHAAIKILHAQLVSEDLEQFRDEARIVARLRHPHIVSILDFNVQDNIPFLVMDYAPNGNLRQRHLRYTTISPPTILTYIKQIADALQYAHNERVIHRDIKPENMLVGGRDEILLSDFGIAVVEQSSRNQMTHDVIGTLAYMSPEQLQGKPRHASDQYSLGVVVYEWLCGDCPFHGSIAEVSAQHIHMSPPSLHEQNANISSAIEEVVFKALAKNPEERYPSVLDFVQAFEAATHQQQIHLTETAASNNVLTSPSNFHITPTVRAAPFENKQREVLLTNNDRKQRISRRTVIVGFIGLTTVGLAGGGISWLAKQYIQGQSQKRIVKPTPTPTPIPVGTTLLTYFGHSDAVNAVAWSPQDGGTYIASGGNDHLDHVWFSSSGTDARSAYNGHTDTVYAVTWSPDGKALASGSADKTVQVWKAFPASGDTPYSYSGHGDVVTALAWSPDGTLIASASNDKTVQIWNAANGSNPYTYSGHSDVVYTVAWSPDGTTIASGSADKTVRLWKASDGSDITSYTGHSDAVKALVWSSDGKYITSGSADKTVQVWEVAAGKLLVTYQGHADVVTAVAWSPDGTIIASASNDKTVQLWSASDGSKLYTYQGHTDTVNSVAWLPGGTILASGSSDKTVQEWQAT